MKRTVILTALVATTVGSILVAQDAGEPTGPFGQAPTKEHQWLKKFVGKWDVTSKAVMGTDHPAIESSGTFNARSLGEYWVVSDVTVDFAGTKIDAVYTVGYSPEKKKFVGTWIGTTDSFMWLYEGSLDERGNTLTLKSEGPNFMGNGEMTNFHDVYEFKSDDHYLIRSSMQDADGEWFEYMTGEARRKD